MMDPEDHVCLCHRVSLHKLRGFLEREKPPVASKLSECLNAGTGCQWCVPYLESLFEQWQQGKIAQVSMTPEQYAQRRTAYREDKKQRALAEHAAKQAQADEGKPRS